MFNQEFFPTPSHVIEMMCEGLTLKDRVILEPSAGKGDIIDFLLLGGSEVFACETNKDLQEILKSKCKLIEEDFFALTSDKISHIDAIVMNPPFSNADKHILHAFNIAPDGCKIVALCNIETLKNSYSGSRKEFLNIVERFGNWQDIGNVFNEAERRTGVEVALITLNKPGEAKTSEFEGFFMDDEPEAQENGIMSYNFVRDLVNRYVGAMKIFDAQLETAVQMNYLTSQFYHSKLAAHCTNEDRPVKRNEFKKDLQKSAWNFVFNKMEMQKHTTRGLREDINKFVEQQQNIPFTMKNIYRMLEIVIGTTGQRMDKAILEVFDRVTEHHHENRFNVKGWKTNSHFLVGKKFILPYMISPAREYGYTSGYYTSLKSSYDGTIPDLEKALCYVTGEAYEIITMVNGREFKEYIKTVSGCIHRNSYGEWYESHFFKFKGYKNGNMHFEFLNEKVWEMFNQRVSKIKGYPLFEAKKQTAYQDRQTGRKPQHNRDTQPPKQAKVLFEIELNPFK